MKGLDNLEYFVSHICGIVNHEHKSINMYELKNIPMDAPTGANYVTHEELEMAIKTIMAQIPAQQPKPDGIAAQF